MALVVKAPDYGVTTLLLRRSVGVAMSQMAQPRKTHAARDQPQDSIIPTSSGVPLGPSMIRALSR
jgi:hypothetical protein